MISGVQKAGITFVAVAYLALAYGTVKHAHEPIPSEFGSVVVCSDILSTPVNAAGLQLSGHICAMCATAVHIGPSASCVIVSLPSPHSLAVALASSVLLEPLHPSSTSRRGPPVSAV